METPAQSPAVARLFRALQERQAWEAQHPELAAAWREANRMDAEWQARREEAEAARRLEADAVYQLHKLGVPKRPAAALLALNESLPGPRAVRRWFDAKAGQPGTFLVLLGGVGTGKTVAAAYAAQTCLLASNPHRATGVSRDAVVWVAAAELAVLSSFTEADRLWFERLQEASLLVLDDVGAEALTEHAQARFERLIDARHGAGRRTLLTSNLAPDALKRRLGERVSDRLREAGRVVNCGNTSLRGVGA